MEYVVPRTRAISMTTCDRSKHDQPNPNKRIQNAPMLSNLVANDVSPSFPDSDVLVELESMKERLAVLQTFIPGDVFMALTAAEQTRLRRQERLLAGCVETLTRQIEAFNHECPDSPQAPDVEKADTPAPAPEREGDSLLVWNGFNVRGDAASIQEVKRLVQLAAAQAES